jgi:hypothetical protein
MSQLGLERIVIHARALGVQVAQGRLPLELGEAVLRADVVDADADACVARGGARVRAVD